MLAALRGRARSGNPGFHWPEELGDVERKYPLWYDLFILSNLEVIKNARGR